MFLYVCSYSSTYHGSIG